MLENIRTQRIEYADNEIAILEVIDISGGEKLWKRMMVVTPERFAQLEKDGTQDGYICIVGQYIYINSKYRGGDLLPVMAKETESMRRDRINQNEEFLHYWKPAKLDRK